MSGKIIYRAIRGHIIVDSVLSGLLLSKVLHDPISTMQKGNELDQNNAMHVLFSKLELSQKAMMDGEKIEEIPKAYEVICNFEYFYHSLFQQNIF